MDEEKLNPEENDSEEITVGEEDKSLITVM